MEKNKFKLKGGAYIITDDASTLWKVISGTLLVYIVPYKNKIPGRRSFIYEANENEMIPSYCYRDMNYQEWRFLFTPLEEVELEKVNDSCDESIKASFAKKVNLQMYKKEGYEESLRNQYEKNLVKEDSFIMRTQKQREDVSVDILEMIYKSFSNQNVSIELPTDTTNLYKSLYILSKYQKIHLVDYDVVREHYGTQATLDEIAKLSHFIYRSIHLEKDWYQKDCGPLLVQWNHLLYPVIRKNNKYVLIDFKTNQEYIVDETMHQKLNPYAYMIYRSFPLTALSYKDIFKFIWDGISKKDLLLLLVLTFVMTFINLLLPMLSQHIFDQYIPLGFTKILIQLGCLLVMFMISNTMILIVDKLVRYKIVSKASYDVQAAFYDRVFKLPESFFRDYDSADLTQRISSVAMICSTILSIILMSVTLLLMVMIQFICLSKYSLSFTMIGLLMILIYTSICFGFKSHALKHKKEVLKHKSEASSKIYQYLMGIHKIRIAGVEHRAIFEYMKSYIQYRNAMEKQKKVLDFVYALECISPYIFLIIFYILMVQNTMTLSIGSFIAFLMIFASFSAGLSSLFQGWMDIKTLTPELQRLKPILNEQTEDEERKEKLKDINGEIEINNLSFGYSEDELVIDELNLNIKAGEYIGVVGASGCGKSTLLKLLLGFEKPISGKIYYDGHDLDGLDKSVLRKKMGVVLQNGSLISGSIYDNIIVTNPNATMQDVKEVIKKVGLEEDIEQMPMGLFTILSEDSQTISGGQMQRILIARALISNPKILFFDEATSSLDNVAQNVIREALDEMAITRMIIAHRISTIRYCDRILVMEKGKIVEQGTFNDLMKAKGLFYQLASRQVLE